MWHARVYVLRTSESDKSSYNRVAFFIICFLSHKRPCFVSLKTYETRAETAVDQRNVLARLVPINRSFVGHVGKHENVLNTPSGSKRKIQTEQHRNKTIVRFRFPKQIRSNFVSPKKPSNYPRTPVMYNEESSDWSGSELLAWLRQKLLSMSILKTVWLVPSRIGVIFSSTVTGFQTAYQLVFAWQYNWINIFLLLIFYLIQKCQILAFFLFSDS